MLRAAQYSLGLMLSGLMAQISAPSIPPPPSPSCEGSWIRDGTYIPRGEVRELILWGRRYRCVGCGGCTPVDDDKAPENAEPALSLPYHDERESAAYPGSGWGGYTPEDIRHANQDRLSPKPSRPKPSRDDGAKVASEMRKIQREVAQVLKAMNSKPAPGLVSEHAYIRYIAERGKYATMDSTTLVLIAKQNADNPAVQRLIQRIMARRRAMAEIMNLIRQSDPVLTGMAAEEAEAAAKRYVLTTLTAAGSIVGPAGLELLDEWIYKEISTEAFVKGVVSAQLTELVQKALADPTIVGQKAACMLGTAVAVIKVYQTVHAAAEAFAASYKALGSYADAVAMRDYARREEAVRRDLIMKWFEIRNKVLEDSAELYRLLHGK